MIDALICHVAAQGDGSGICRQRLRVAVIGAPNVGKSSLLNALVGEKTSIVTDLAGTTRDQIRGFAGNFEIIDTPGMFKSETLLGKHMRKSISAAVTVADVILYVLDATNFDKGEVQKISNYRQKEIPVIIAVNKVDITKPDKLFPKLETLRTLDFVRAIVPISAKTGNNIDIILRELSAIAPVTQPIDDDTYTDQSIRQMACEIIRGNVIQKTRQEIPHGITVVITKFLESDTATEIHAEIICEKPTHKPIIIGAKGSLLKAIGTKSRLEIEKLTDTRIKLYTHVVVRPNWKNDKEIIKSELV